MVALQRNYQGRLSQPAEPFIAQDCGCDVAVVGNSFDRCWRP
jgi:hypothetical protein